MRVSIKLFILSLVTLAVPLAHAQTAADEAAEYQDIEVIGIRDAYRLTPIQLREAVAAFAQYRATYAPQATLMLRVFRYRLDPTLQDVRFRLLADNGDAIPITLDADGRFTLPPVDYAAKTYSLQANRRAGSVRVRPFALSPGSSDESFAVGDLRLTCRVAWAIMRQTVSVAAKGLLGLVGGPCTSSRIGAYFGTERPLASASVTYGTMTKPVPLRPDGSAFRYPGYDRSIPNDARLRLVYR